MRMDAKGPVKSCRKESHFTLFKLPYRALEIFPLLRLLHFPLPNEVYFHSKTFFFFLENNYTKNVA